MKTYEATIVHLSDESSVKCKCSSCEWRGSVPQLSEIGKCNLTPGDPSPAGRCPECDSIAEVLVEKQEIELENFRVSLVIDNDGHLSIYVRSYDGSTPREVESDIGAQNEIAFRVTTDLIEQTYRSTSQPGVEVQTVKDMSHFITCAADSVQQLRETDVYRVLVESNDKKHQADIAKFIKHHRPDLADEVDEVLADEMGA